MIIGACSIELRIPGNRSLKGKRSALKPLLARLRREFNVSTAEVGFTDSWQTAEVALVTVANNDPGYVQRFLEKVVEWVKTHWPELQVVDWHIETF
ncbi:MAG: DUF503 domain-containing protein [Anaerolineae bacterium]|jgi:uncharacterized protein YlxP (DUF503 family)